MELKNRIKNVICVFSAAVLAFNFAGCSKEITGNPESSAVEPSENSVSADGENSNSSSNGRINPLSGLDDLSDSAQGKRPYAVVVENSPAARPQWGISTPDILVEGMAEGGITRMLLLYSDVVKIPKIGPLRSARHDFVEISQCFDSIFVHCGWSTYAKKKIESEGVNNLNGIIDYSPRFFYRDSSKGSAGVEHTGYTNGGYIKATVSALKYRTEIKSDYKNVFSFNSPDSPSVPSGGTCSDVSFTFSIGNEHSLKYQNGLYYDNLNGGARKDDGNVQLNYKNILVLFCDVNLMGDKAGCVDMKLEAANSGYYISQGGYEKISWQKTGSAASSKLSIKNSKGSGITLNAGRTYIAIVPSSQKSTFKIS